MKVNTDKILGNVSQYFEEHLTQIEKEFRSRRWIHPKYVVAI